MINWVNTLMSMGTGILFLSSIPMIRRVWQNKDNLKDYDFRGSFSIFIANICFNTAFFLMKNYTSILLNITTLFFWGFVSVYSYNSSKQTVREDEKL